MFWFLWGLWSLQLVVMYYIMRCDSEMRTNLSFACLLIQTMSMVYTGVAIFFGMVYVGVI